MIYPTTFEKKLEFNRIRQMLSENCLCELGRQRVDKIAFSTDFEFLGKELELTDEMRRILLFEENFYQDNYIDATASLIKIRLPGTYLELTELNDLRKSLDTLQTLTRFLLHEDIREKYSFLAKEAAAVVFFPFVSDRIDAILNKQGVIRDNASPELRNIRGQIKQKQTAVNRRLIQILKSAQQEGFTEADAEITIRDGRPVIPVIAGSKRKLGGIVHDESSTGKTVFVEPAEVVELNNELRELAYAERREIIRILTLFADDLRPYIDDLLIAYDFLGEIDFLRAKGKFALHIGAVRPILQQADFFEWRKAVHPLLYLAHKAEGKEVVPLDLRLDAQNRILLISGPNAGGKSVCLKTTGLLQYMLQCGLLVPMGENSEVCLFNNIFIDIGDEQSIDNDLSTYSSHLMNMKHFVKFADNKTLVLIDEFGTGTEPALGGAIAESILGEMNDNKAYGVITTHYANLKHFGSETTGIINGAMLFDTQKIQPLFKLVIGRPGSSFAIDIARKIGLPENILKSAADKVGEDYINFEKHLREIIRDKKYWEEKRSRIRKVEKTLDELYARYGAELEDLQKERKKILSEARAEAQQLLKEANKRVEGTIREIRESSAEKERTRDTRAQLEEYRKQLEKGNIGKDEYEQKLIEIRKAGRRLADKSPELTQAKVNQTKKEEEKSTAFQTGDIVRMKGQETVGEIMEINDKSILVAFGSMITTVEPAKLEHAKGEKLKAASGSSLSSNISERRLNFKSEIDIRGKRADEALAIVRDLVDDAVLSGVRTVKVLHGKGNGILRQLIRDYLDTVDVVGKFYDEHADRGGTGITIIEIDI